MTILFFDVETTGFSSSARVVQVAWMMRTSEGEPVGDDHSFIIKPDGYEIPERSTKIHGITTQSAIDNGEDWKRVITLFISYMLTADVLVGHNVAFDVRMMHQEIGRGWENDITAKETECTMSLSTAYCGKKPKLQELHNILFGVDFEGAHDAMSDVHATAKCYWELKRLGVI